jgi:hypothetical protein
MSSKDDLFNEFFWQFLSSIKIPKRRPETCTECESAMLPVAPSVQQFTYHEIRRKRGMRRVATVCSELCALEYERKNLPSRFLAIEKGYVYLMHSRLGYKIGMTRKTVAQRKKELENKHKVQIRVIHTIEAPYALAGEKYLQYHFEDYQIKNREIGREWFDLKDSQIKYIIRIKAIEAWLPYDTKGLVVFRLPYNRSE